MAPVYKIVEIVRIRASRQSTDVGACFARAVAPCDQVAGWMYAALSERGYMPGRVWLLLVAFGCVLPEMLHRSVSDNDYKT